MNENRERHETNRNTNKLHYILFWIYCQMIKCGYGHPQNNTRKRANTHTHTHTMRNNVQCELSILLGIYMYNAMQMRKCHVSILITIYVIQTLTQTWYDPWNNEHTNWIMCIYAICLIYFSPKKNKKKNSFTSWQASLILSNMIIKKWESKHQFECNQM